MEQKFSEFGESEKLLKHGMRSIKEILLPVSCWLYLKFLSLNSLSLMKIFRENLIMLDFWTQRTNTSLNLIVILLIQIQTHCGRHSIHWWDGISKFPYRVDPNYGTCCKTMQAFYFYTLLAFRKLCFNCNYDANQSHLMLKINLRAPYTSRGISVADCMQTDKVNSS